LIHSGGFLGLACEETTKGLEVIKVVAQSPAERMGMLEGDILLSFNQTPLTTRENLIILVSQKPPGETVTLHYKRNNREVSVQVRLGTRTPP
jgi:serine protease Do